MKFWKAMPTELSGKLQPRILREELKIYRGAFIESWSEINHTTIFYAFNPAKGGPQKCTSCTGGSPVIIRYERDHSAREFYDAFCESCSPKKVIEKMSQG